ncbi:unnamed protein product, partial [Rotaria sp. Silwood2]
PYFFILACFDRYCSSSPSPTHRSWSNKTTAKRRISGAIILVAFLYVHMPIFFEIQSNGTSTICFPQQGVYNSFWRTFYLIMYFFSINLPTSTNVGDLHRRLDRNLMRLLFSHFLTQIACIFSFVIVNLLEF